MQFARIPGSISSAIEPLSPYHALGFGVGVGGIAVCGFGIVASIWGLRRAASSQQVKISVAGVICGLLGTLFFLLLVLVNALSQLDPVVGCVVLAARAG